MVQHPDTQDLKGEDASKPVFRTEATRVQVSVVVLDATGQPVRDLGPEELQLFENGAPQALASFEFVDREKDDRSPDLHNRSASSGLTWPDSPTTNGAVSTSRLVALILDDLHIDVRRTRSARSAARLLLTRLDPDDLLYVRTTSSSTPTAVFSRDRRAALRTIEGMTGQRLPDKTPAERRYPGQNFEAERLDHHRRLCEAIRDLSLQLREVQGRRKNVLLVSEGSSAGASMSDVRPGLASGTASRYMQDALAAAAEADVAIYPFSPAGLDSFEGDVVESFGLVTHEVLTSMREEFVQAKVMARDLASMTGGVSFVDTNEPASAVSTLLRDASVHYVVSYDAPNPTKRGFRRIEVKARRQDVRVLARRGYWSGARRQSPAAFKINRGLSPELRDLLNAVVPGEGLRLQVHAAPVTLGRSLTTMAVVIEVGGAGVLGQGHGGDLQLDHAVLTIDSKGKPSKGTHRSLAVTLTPMQLNALAASGVRSVWALELPAGHHQLRIAAIDRKSGRSGSLHAEIEVPGAGQPAGDALVSSRVLSIMPTPFVDERIASLLAVTPTATRVFPVGDELTLTVAGGEPVLWAARLVRQDRSIVWESPPREAGVGPNRIAVPVEQPGAFVIELLSTEATISVPIVVIEP